MKRVFRGLYKYYQLHIKHLSINEYNILVYRKKGMKIGNNCSINSVLTFGKDAFLIEIGNSVTISTGCKILPHDASIGNVTNYELTDLFGKVVIGDNCFIGAGAILLPGVSLANKTIVAAGSVVTHSVFKEGLVIGGNPARIICTVGEFISKNKNRGFNVAGLDNVQVKDVILKNKNRLLNRKTIEK